jgi:5-methylcytosine-specific restriction endonuclease McrA
MPRLFNFSKTTQDAALFRQKFRCAWCCEHLSEVIFHGHHVVPGQAATARTPGNQWLRTEENCVMLCDHCHAVHGHEDGKYAKGAVPYARSFRYSHGPDFKAHKNWADRVDSRPWPK